MTTMGPSPLASYAATTHAARSRLRRFSHGARFDLATVLATPHRSATVLDYGCGDAAYLMRLAAARPDLRLLAWHPFAAQRPQLVEHVAAYPTIEVVDDIDGVAAGSVDVVTVLEVFEHLPPSVIGHESDRIERILAPHGRLVVTVPIEVGPGSVAKNLARAATRSTHEGTTVGSIVRAAFGRPVGRPADDYILTHVGFDHRALLGQLSARAWVVERRRTSPLPVFGAVLNSQIGWRLSRGQVPRRRFGGTVRHLGGAPLPTVGDTGVAGGAPGSA